MAKGDSGSQSTTPMNGSGLGTFTKTSQTPQQNQYLQSNPSTDSEANTRWMNPSDTSPTTGINGGGGGQQAQQIPVQNGTMLGQITAGNVGQYMPGGYDQGKFSDPNKHDPKYDVGRILSKYPPSTQGLQAAMSELGPMGYRMTGKDTIVGPDGVPVDVGFSFGSGQNSAWQWNPNDPNASSQGQQQGSMLGQQPQNQNNFLQQMFQQLMAQRQQYANQQFNPTGGVVQQPVGTPYANNGPITPPMFGNQPQSGINGMPMPIAPMTTATSMIGDQGQARPNSFMYWPGMTMQPGVNY